MVELPLTDPYWCGSMSSETHSIIHLQVNDSMTLVSTGISEMGGCASPAVWVG